MRSAGTDLPSPPKNAGPWLKYAAQQLHHVDSPRLDAELILCFVLGCNRAALFARPEKALTEKQLQTLDELVNRRVQGEPVAYLTGEREFWSMSFDVNKHVLVPRPETELMVELALQALSSGTLGPVLDAGTGSGAIAIALYRQWHDDRMVEHGNGNENGIAKQIVEGLDERNVTLSITASDFDEHTLAVAKRNASKHQATAIHFVLSDWLDAFAENHFGMILSNPPYLAADDPHMGNDSLCREPIAALVSGNDGLDAIRRIIQQACVAGMPGCTVLIEHGYQQAKSVQDIMRLCDYTDIQTHQDLNGLDRVTGGYCPEY